MVKGSSGGGNDIDYYFNYDSIKSIHEMPLIATHNYFMNHQEKLKATN